ncbi:MAG: hypothetical protein LLF92_08435 [Planctomycetaceae bacterium]|nr:hypothetical protein [Planctomycetaceae bacterium]
MKSETKNFDSMNMETRPSNFCFAEKPSIFADLMTEEELIIFLRIPEISNSEDYHNVIENLKRMHGLPRIHICGKVIYPREAILEWVRAKTITEK